MQISLNSYKPSVLFVRHMHTVETPAKRRRKRYLIRSVFDNASARDAIEYFLYERKRSPRCLQELAIQVDRCIARNSKMTTKTIVGFASDLYQPVSNFLLIEKVKLAYIKDICGYFPCAPFPRLETSKVVWFLSFDLSRIRINIAFRYSYAMSVLRHFLTK